eukprot:g2311.t1
MYRVSVKQHRSSSNNALWKPPKPTEVQVKKAIFQAKEMVGIRVPDLPKDALPLGITLRKNDEGKLGVTFDEDLNVVDTEPWAEMFGLQVGMKVVACGGKRVKTMKDLVALSKMYQGQYALDLDVIHAPTATTLKRAQSLVMLWTAADKRKHRMSRYAESRLKALADNGSKVESHSSSTTGDAGREGGRRVSPPRTSPPRHPAPPLRPPIFVFEHDHPMWIFAADMFREEALKASKRRLSQKDEKRPKAFVFRRRASSTAQKNRDKVDATRAYQLVCGRIREHFNREVLDPGNIARLKELAKAKGDVVKDEDNQVYGTNHPVWTFATDVFRANLSSNDADALARVRVSIESTFGSKMRRSSELRRLKQMMKDVRRESGVSADKDGVVGPPVPQRRRSSPADRRRRSSGKKKRALKTKCSFANLVSDIGEALGETETPASTSVVPGPPSSGTDKTTLSPASSSRRTPTKKKSRRLSLFSALSDVAGPAGAGEVTLATTKKQSNGAKKKKSRRVSLFSVLSSMTDVKEPKAKDRDGDGEA